MENIYTFNCALWIKAFQWTKLVNSLNDLMYFKTSTDCIKIA